MGRHHRRILNEAKRRYNEKQKEAKNIIEKSKVLDHLTSTLRITLILIILMIILTPILVYVRKHQTISKNIQLSTFTRSIPQISELVPPTSMSNIPNLHFEAETVNYSHTQPPLSSAYKSILGSENVISNTESYPHQHELQGLINGVKGAMKDLHSFRSVKEFY